MTTTSAQTAWEYTTNGWRCENDRGKPLNLELLELFAKTEKALSDANNQANFFKERRSPASNPMMSLRTALCRSDQLRLMRWRGVLHEGGHFERSDPR